MNLLGNKTSDRGAVDFEEKSPTSRDDAELETGLIAEHDLINKENIRENGTRQISTMESISSFLETVHSNHLTLRRLAKVQQRRIDELKQENTALRQASELKDEEIRKTKEHLDLLRSAMEDTDLSEIESPPDNNRSPSNAGRSPRLERSGTPKDSAESCRPTYSARKKSSSDRRKTSIIVSHKVALKRVVNLMRKINGASNRRSVGM